MGRETISLSRQLPNGRVALATVLGAICGALTVAIGEWVSFMLLPLPAEVRILAEGGDTEILEEAIRAGKIPLANLVGVVLSWALGAATASVAATLFASGEKTAGRRAGVILLCLTLVTLFSVYHPPYVFVGFFLCACGAAVCLVLDRGEKFRFCGSASSVSCVFVRLGLLLKQLSRLGAFR